MSAHYGLVISEVAYKGTLDAINQLGYAPALDLAYEKALSIASKTPHTTLAIKWLAWSGNLLHDARTKFDVVEAEPYYLLSRFYRKLAHRLYWHQRRHNTLEPNPEFIQCS